MKYYLVVDATSRLGISSLIIFESLSKFLKRKNIIFDSFTNESIEKRRKFPDNIIQLKIQPLGFEFNT